MKMLVNGFTMIELMITLLILALMVVIAFPAYESYVVRSKISEALSAIGPAKEVVVEAFTTSGMQGVTRAANAFNNYPNITFDKLSSYYVMFVYINPSDGVISVTTTSTPGRLPDDATTKSLTLNPNIRGQVLADGLVGPIEWGCSSQTHEYATARGMQINSVGTLDPKYAPASCR